MKIIRTSMLTGIQREKDLPVTEEEIQRWRNGELIQKVWPNLSPADREFLISGCTDEEFKEAFGAD